MTSTDVKAGYELDILVLSKILGWDFPSDEKVQSMLEKHRLLNRWKKNASKEYRVPVGGIRVLDEVVYARAIQSGGKYTWKFDVEMPSRDLKHAFMVVEAMRKDDFSFSLRQFALPGTGRHHATVSFICNYGPCPKHPWNQANNHHGAYDVEAETIPLAICKAALIAKKVIDG